MQIGNIKFMDIFNLELAQFNEGFPASLQVRVTVLCDNSWTGIRTRKLLPPWSAECREIARDAAAE